MDRSLCFQVGKILNFPKCRVLQELRAERRQASLGSAGAVGGVRPLVPSAAGQGDRGRCRLQPRNQLIGLDTLGTCYSVWLTAQQHGHRLGARQWWGSAGVSGSTPQQLPTIYLPSNLPPGDARTYYSLRHAASDSCARA